MTISTVIAAVFVCSLPAFAGEGVLWRHISSAQGLIPAPDAAPEPTATIVVDIDKDGTSDFVIGSRAAGPAVVWYRRTPNGWRKYVIEREMCSIEAGGSHYDIDGDGDEDIVFAGDSRSNEIWWWENPYPNFDPNGPWPRRSIKKSGANKHHDQIFGDLDGDGRKELISWNQGAQQLLAFRIPKDVRSAGEWPATVLYQYEERKPEHEGLALADINGDKRLDIIGAGRWFENLGGMKFAVHIVDDAYRFSRALAGDFIKGGRPEIVFGPGDNILRLRLYEWKNGRWSGRDLLPGEVNHGHSLEMGDIDRDGNLDIFVGEMGQWGPKKQPPDNPFARLWVLYGDGKGGFRTQLVDRGQGTHEAKLGDLDGDGDLDIIGKPFRHNTPRLDVYWNEGQGQNLALNEWRRHAVDTNKPHRAIFIAAGDLDNDGLPDIVAGAAWYRNSGQAGGQWKRDLLPGELKNMALVKDLTGDGLPDILGTRGAGSQPNADFYLARNLGEGRFETALVARAQGDFLQGVAARRFDPRGPLQIALSWHKAGFGVQLLTPGSPWQWTKISDFSQDEDLSAGDIDGDGKIDLLLGTRWLRNEGGSWKLHTLSDSPGEPDRNRLADINGDGKLDAVVGFEAVNKPGKLAWYEQGASPFAPWTEHVIATPVGPMSLDVADMDGDGDLDIIVGEHNYKDPSAARLLIFENLGRGKAWKTHIIHTGDEHHCGARVVDIDGDGDLDIISIGWTHPNVILYENLARKASSAAAPAKKKARSK